MPPISKRYTIPSFISASRMLKYANTDISSCATITALYGVICMPTTIVSNEQHITHVAAVILPSGIDIFVWRNHSPIVSPRIRTTMPKRIITFTELQKMPFSFSLFPLPSSNVTNRLIAPMNEVVTIENIPTAPATAPTIP